MENDTPTLRSFNLGPEVATPLFPPNSAHLLNYGSYLDALRVKHFYWAWMVMGEERHSKYQQQPCEMG